MRPHLSLAVTTLALLVPVTRADTLKVFLMAGQSNMEGHAYTYEEVPWNIPTLQFLLENPAYIAQLPTETYTFKSQLTPAWSTPRNDAWAVQFDSLTGSMRQSEPTPADDQTGWVTAIAPLSPGFGSSDGFSSFGPELGMAHYLGDRVDSPLLLVKSNRGGRTLAINFRPPGAGGTTGSDYLNMVGQYKQILDTLDADLADNGVLDTYNNATGYEIAAFVWFQGWNELFVSPAQKAGYADNLVHLVHDLRASDDRIPADLPMIIPESADQDDGLNASRISAVATLNAESPGSAVFIENNDMKGNDWPGYPFSQEWGFHFNARAENYLEIGWRIGIATLEGGYVDEGPLSLGGSVSSATFDRANLFATINDDAQTITVVWDTVDHGRGSTADWPNTQELGGWTGGAGQVATTLTNLQENTAYVFRFFATNTVLDAEAWSALVSFETPYENPPPLLGFTEITPPAADGTIASTTLSRTDATSVSIVWANTDQGTTDVATWQNAPGGGSADLGPASVDDLIVHQITGLDANTDYVFRFVATNTFGSDWTPPAPFTTAREGSDFQLTAYYNFEGPEPGSTNDYPGAGSFADDLVNNGTWFVPDVAANAKGSTQAAGFDGNVALYTDAFTTDLGPDPDAFTIMFWIKAADASQENNNTRLMTTRVKPAGAGNATTPAWQVEGFGNNGNNGGKMDVRIGHPTAGLWFSPDAAGALADFEESATWHHVAFVLANSGHPETGKNYGETFVDGVTIGGPQTQREDRPWDGVDMANTDGMLIIGGAATNGSSRGFTGLLDDVALFAGVVPAAEIAAVADGLKNPADFLAATEPPPFNITAVTLEPNGQITLTWQSQPGESYNLLWSPDLTTPPTPLPTPIQATDTTTTTTINNPSPAAPQLYLRVSKTE